MAEDQLTIPSDKGVESATRNIGRMPGYPRVNLFFFLTFLAFVIFRYVDGGHRMDILETIRFEFILGGSAIIMAIIKMTGQPVQVGAAKRIVILIGLLFLAMIVQLPMAWDPDEAQRVFVDRVFKFALLSFLIATMVESPQLLKIFLGAFLFAIFYITLESTQGLISGSLVWENQGIPRLHGAVPMYGHPNSLGGVAMGTLPFVVFLFVPVRHWILRLGLLAASVTSMACVIYSGSRTAYVGLISLFLWQFFQSHRKGRFILVGAIVGAIALSVMPEEYIERFKSIGGKEAEGSSKEKRIEILEDAIIILMENPAGIGVASFPAIRRVRFGRSQDTHNLYLEVATNLGVQGFIIFMALVGVMMFSFRHSALAFRSQRVRLIRLMRFKGVPPGAKKHIRNHERDLAFCYSAAQATAGFILIRLVLGLFGMDLYEIYWWFASGVALALGGLVVTTNRKTRFFEKLAIDENKDVLA
jgi:putative inorganic carbon (hco3(-)) transporter